MRKGNLGVFGKSKNFRARLKLFSSLNIIPGINALTGFPTHESPAGNAVRFGAYGKTSKCLRRGHCAQGKPWSVLESMNLVSDKVLFQG